LKESKYSKFVKRVFNGLPELSWLLEHEKHIIVYGTNRKNAYFTCASCGHSCVCCEEAQTFSLEEIISHVNKTHLD
jgi:hypothetical protein